MDTKLQLDRPVYEGRSQIISDEERTRQSVPVPLLLGDVSDGLVTTHGSAAVVDLPKPKDQHTVASHRVRDLFRGFSSVGRSRTCGDVIGAASVAVKETPSGRVAGWLGVETCGKRSCPVCGPRINAIRASEIETALTRHHAAGGGSVLWLRSFQSLPGDTFTSSARRFSKAWRRMTASHKYKTALKAAGVEHTIWGRDDTFSDGYNAAHYHRHGVFLFTRILSGDELRSLEKSTFEAWREACRKTGAGAPTPDANGFEEIRDAGALARYIARAVREVGRPDVKDGLSGLTPQQIRARFLETGDVADLERVHDWEQSLLDRSCGAALYWSPGAKAAFGIGEKDDVDLLGEEVEGLAVEETHTLTPEEWQAVRSVPGRTGVLLVLARVYGMDRVREALIVWVDAWRFRSRRLPRGSIMPGRA